MAFAGCNSAPKKDRQEIALFISRTLQHDFSVHPSTSPPLIPLSFDASLSISDMLLDVGRAARRHATSELRRHRGTSLTLLRSFSASILRSDAHELPYLLPGQFQPRAHPNPAAKEIAVLGGGVTGLSAAYNLANSIPHANITVYEKSERVGGWIDSEVVPVNGGEVLFEWGPRSLRPSIQGAGWATINLLGSFTSFRLPERQMLRFSKSHKAATNRFLYYPDHLVRMPTGSGNIITSIFDSVRSLLTEPIFKGIVSRLFREPTQAQRPMSMRDESVGDFLMRRFGPELTDNIASAAMHGIYAGDIYSLSARTLLPSLWFLETRDPDADGIILESLHMFFTGKKLLAYEDVKFRNMTPLKSAMQQRADAILQVFDGASVLSWADGMGMLIEELVWNLKAESRVSIKTNAGIEGLSYEKDTQKVVVSTGSESKSFDYAISTLSPGAMKAAIRAHKPLALDTFDPVNKSVSVMVVNLWYNEQILSPQHEGFGYLIPRSVPLEENPERALGVIFAHNLSGDTTEATTYTREDFVKKVEGMQEWIDKSSEILAGEVMQSEKASEAREERSDRERKEFDEMKRFVQENFNSAQRVVDQMKSQLDTVPETTQVKSGQDTVQGSKIGVMLGGHWWSGWQDGDFPSEQEGIAMAKSLLQRHLKVTIEPEVAKARLQMNCIPQYPVGYRDMMADIHKKVLMEGFEGRLKVAGPWYQGAVGVNDCIRRAKEVSIDISEGWNENTGLEKFTEDEKWLLEDKDSGVIKVDPLSV